jgi:3'-phosphoadenosine 5'-phosphosulfate sulfotransferase (PAPS reductase)/FAD synthetase
MGQQGIWRMHTAAVLKRGQNMEHILSLSYGKDSLACLGAIEQLGWPLDRIVHAEVWATDTIPADLPPMVEFKAKADCIIKERWGIEVEHVKGKLTYEQIFYRVLGGEKRPGEIYGWPYQRGPWCNSRLKQHILSSTLKGTIQYIGIAVDEPNRFHTLSDAKKSPLVEAGWTEVDCRKWCEENGMLSPIYTTATRGGCWFCHNQSVGQLRLLRKNYPDLWALMLKWDADSPVSFKPDGHTVHDYEERFALEDNGFIAANDKFLWDMLKYSQISVDYYTRSDFVG